ncbi:UNVERIFIED_ORG: hypothetical protein M2414_005203 [Rahnella aquatilis]|nr:hypothetical protein SRABI106_00634 [Rahnella aquatilis]
MFPKKIIANTYIKDMNMTSCRILTPLLIVINTTNPTKNEKIFMELFLKINCKHYHREYYYCFYREMIMN